MTARLTLTVEGDDDDLDFLRSRIQGQFEESVEELVEEYKANLDTSEFVTGWEFDRDVI